MDPLSALLGAAAVFIAKPLIQAVSPMLAQATLPDVIKEFKVKGQTEHLDSPEKLKEMIKSGDVKPGQYVEGTGFFSLSTVSHVPDVPLMMQLQAVAGGMVQAAITGDASAMGNPLGYVLPTSRYPIVHDEYRVGFLYPHYMFGFGVPLFNDGTVRSLPFRGRQVCVVRIADLPPIDNTIVKYRARIIVIPRSDVAREFPGIRDDVYDNMLNSGLLYVLSIIEDNTFINYYEASPHEIIAGSHFVETHWERPELLNNPEFAKAIETGIKAGAEEIGYAPPQYMFEHMKRLNTWHGGSYSLTQPAGLPYFHLQMNTNLRENDQSAQIRRDFDRTTRRVFSEVSAKIAYPEETKDVNGVDNFESEKFTILQSTAARNIDDSVLRVMRHWLERKQPDSEASRTSESPTN